MASAHFVQNSENYGRIYSVFNQSFLQLVRHFDNLGYLILLMCGIFTCVAKTLMKTLHILISNLGQESFFIFSAYSLVQRSMQRLDCIPLGLLNEPSTSKFFHLLGA